MSGPISPRLGARCAADIDRADALAFGPSHDSQEFRNHESMDWNCLGGRAASGNAGGMLYRAWSTRPESREHYNLRPTVGGSLGKSFVCAFDQGCKGNPARHAQESQAAGASGHRGGRDLRSGHRRPRNRPQASPADDRRRSDHQRLLHRVPRRHVRRMS